MAERPSFEDFKRRALANPEVRKAYVDARVRFLVESKKPS